MPSSVPIYQLLTFGLVTLCLAQECFFPSGDIAANWTLCPAYADSNYCCYGESYCISGGMCMGASGHYYRAACTDADWGLGCSDYCLEHNSTSWQDMYWCGESEYGCHPECTWSSYSEPKYTFSSFDLQPQPSQISEFLRQAGLPEAVTSTATPNMEPTTDPSNGLVSPERPRYGPGAMAGVGVGVGAPLALALAGAIFLLLREKRRNRELQPPDQPSPGADWGEAGPFSPGTALGGYNGGKHH